MKQNFDLHIHTNNSDGEYSTKEIVDILKKENIKYFSITDHDSIDSYYELKNIELDDLKYISGIEISTILDDKYKLHILGYNYNDNNTKIKELTNKIKNKRIERLYKLSDTLKEKYNITITKEEIDNLLKEVKGTVGKPHLAKLLIKKNYVKTTTEAFEKYLNNISAITKYRIDFKEVVDAIHSSGGFVIWAHPKKVEEKYNIDFNKLLDIMIPLGLDGIEVYNSIHLSIDSKRYLKTCLEKGLYISGGSDYHGPHIKEKVRLGILNKDNNYDIINIDTINVLKKE